jgi:hypothetical protein
MTIETTLPEKVLATLRQTPEVLEKLLQAASEEEMQWKPSPERWSIAEVLGHLNDVEREIYRRRLQKFLDEEDLPLLVAYDQNAAYDAGKYSGLAAREQLKKFAGERWHSMAMLYQLPPGAEQQVGKHTRFGRVSLLQMLNEWAYHDLGHIRQIIELYRARVFHPEMGPYRDYYMPQP